MAHILVLGGGLSGCTAALELANKGQKVTIVEKSSNIGGKVREYGCKSAANCENCGVCLAGGLWEAVENNSNIEIITGSELIDVTGIKGSFTVHMKGPQGYKSISEINSILVSIGFERAASQSYGQFECTDGSNIISGFELESLISNRNRKGILTENCSRIAFIQCFGSRDIQEKALYCSRVCCAYSTRAAKTLKHCNPAVQITFFYMDFQYVREGQYFDELLQDGFEFIPCRPIKMKSGNPAKIIYEDPETGTVVEREFDFVVFSEGIHPAADTERIAELCGLGINAQGFLRCVRDGEKTGIYVAGCATGPKRIEEVYGESLTVARQMLAQIG